MTRDTLKDDLKLFNLDESATAEETRSAYHRMKALYAETSLATYSLLTAEERQETLDRIERAYMRITMEMESRPPRPQPAVAPGEDDGMAPPDAGESIGKFLKHRREDLGLTLRDVANRTRIRATYLEHIENEQLADLPAPVYLRGFVLEFARALEISDPGKVAARYLELIQEEEG